MSDPTLSDPTLSDPTLSDPMSSDPVGTTVRQLPERPNLEHLRAQARGLQRAVRAADPHALATVEAFDPSAATDPAWPSAFALTSAQLVLARSYGFASWQRLHERVDTITRYGRWIEPPAAVARTDGAADPDVLLRLCCLNYTGDDARSLAAARTLLAAHPDLAGADLYTAAATGDIAAAERLLAAADDPAPLVNTDGGPFAWPPLLYLAYSRLGDGPGRNAVETATLLLAAGADPDAGYLWRGETSPFTALTGVFGGGEQEQPAHPDAPALARLLLDAGADPNDNQALYNRMFSPADDHLALLFSYGLGTDRDSAWRRRLDDAYPSPQQMVGEQLRWAAGHDMADRVRLLLDQGVDPDARGYHPAFGDQTPYRLAMLAGNRRIAGMLVDAGADTAAARLDAVDEFGSVCLAGDRGQAKRLLAADPGLLDATRQRRPDLLVAAADTGRTAAVRLLLDLGVPVDDTGDGQRTALHQAAWDGHRELVELLLDRGADPARRDGTHNATPGQWAARAGHTDLARLLAR